tara:strand:+ start:107 stop:607 length:501 start_codon:yes stop_codon:yes gene_type:complete
MIPTIQIKDNFLNEKEFKILYNNVDKVSYVPKVDIEGRNYGFRYEFGENSDNQWLLKKIKKQFFPNTNLKPNGCMHYHLRHNHEKVLAHTDPNDDYCFILYLKGEELVYNGTGFYHENNLNTYVGFVENRAIFFDGKNNLHTDLQALGESSFRYTIIVCYNHGEKI